jgi:hypothetical protein
MKRKVRINFSDFWHPDTLEAKLANPIYQLYKLCDWAFGFDYLTIRVTAAGRITLLSIGFCCSCRETRRLLLPKKEHFCASIYSNENAKERLWFSMHYRSTNPSKVRNNLGYRVGDKIEFLRKYKFNIAFENESYPGYTSEKLPETFAANSVPVYCGNPLIEREFNREALVNLHDFRSLTEVVDAIVELDRNDALYRQYLAAPVFPNERTTEFIDPQRILDRFETIFNTKMEPVANTVRGRVARLLREPRRLRDFRKRSKRVATVKPFTW